MTPQEIEDKIHEQSKQFMIDGKYPTRAFLSKSNYKKIWDHLQEKALKHGCGCCFCKSKKLIDFEPAKKLQIATAGGYIEIIAVGEDVVYIVEDR